MRTALLMAGLVVAGCADPRPVDDGRRCATPADCETIHPPGIADPASPDFHANLVVSSGWNLGECQRCHGDDFAGGKSGKTCLGCHAEKPTSCTTCHAQPPPTGAHQAHTSRYGCSECHVVPHAWDDVGHIFDDHGKPLARPAIVFGATARTNGAAPHWDGDTKRCDNTYCHGPASPQWTGGSGEAACGSCHGKPPASHASARCGDCHAQVADNSAQLVGSAPKHADGKVNVGDDSGTCLACHKTPGGAHAAHTSARHRITRPLACTDCHRVPTALHDPGHIDQPGPVVFPDGTSELARANGATPTWNPATSGCSGTWCHGAQQPVWSGPPVICGSCHGVPPADASHTPAMHLGDCVTCHAASIDATGQLLPPPAGKHLDGVVDAP